MDPLLALSPDQLPTSWNIAGFLGCAYFLLSLMQRGMAVWAGLNGKKSPDANPQPFMVRKAEDTVSDDDFEEFRQQHHADKESLKNEIVERFERLQKARSDSIAHLHDHLRGSEARVKAEFIERIGSLSQQTQDLLKEQGKKIVEHGERIAALEALIKKGARA